MKLSLSTSENEEKELVEVHGEERRKVKKTANRNQNK